MSKFIVRWTIVLVSIYLIVCYLTATIAHVDIWRQLYILLFELCVCLCISKQGVYHCKYIKWTAYAILAQDVVVCADVMIDVLPDGAMAMVPPIIISTGLVITLTLAVRHYIKVRRIKRIWR